MPTRTFTHLRQKKCPMISLVAILEKPMVIGLSANAFKAPKAEEVTTPWETVRRPHSGQRLVCIRIQPCSLRQYGTCMKRHCKMRNALTSAKGGTAPLLVWVGHAHALWTLLDALQMDEATAATDIVNDARGQPPTKRVKRTTRDHQHKSVDEVLRALGHCICLSVA